jgi:hypothetical protein
VCTLVSTDPPKPGQHYDVSIAGPGVVGQGGRAGALDAGGQVRESFPINMFGTYTVTATVTDADGTVRTSTQTVVVTDAAGACP